MREGPAEEEGATARNLVLFLELTIGSPKEAFRRLRCQDQIADADGEYFTKHRDAHSPELPGG